MKNGFIYPIFDCVIQKLKFLSLVEFFKWTFVKLFASEKAESKKQCARIAVDCFQIFKWLFILVLIGCHASHPIFEYLAYYMIASNLYSYFYYHAWGSNFVQSGDADYIKSRFMNTLLAIAYFILCYAYLYKVHFSDQIIWPNCNIDFLNSLYLSIANAFTLTYGGFLPNTQNVRILFATELLNSFLFFTIIISNSVPNPRKPGE